MSSNLDRSLESLDPESWLEPNDNAAYTFKECYRLRSVLLKDLTSENLRLLIGQGIELVYLVPLALDELERDPWSSGDLYEGALLKSVVSVRPEFWSENPNLGGRLAAVIEVVQINTKRFEEEIYPEWLKIWK